MQFELGAAIRTRAVEVDLAGHTYRIPARPAGDWILALHEGTWTAIVPGWLVDAGEELDDALQDGTLTVVDMARVAKDALEAAAGCRWWTALKLMGAARADAGVLGELALIDLATAPLGRYVQAVYRLYTRHATKQQIVRVDAELERPPEGVSVQERYDPQEAAANFEAAMRARGLS